MHWKRSELNKIFLNKLNMKVSNQTWKYQTFKFCQTMIKAYINMRYKKKTGNFSVFGKVIQWNGKISNFCASRTTLWTKKLSFASKKFFFWKMFLWVQNSICIWKKKQKKLRHQKSASHATFIYEKCRIIFLWVFLIFPFKNQFSISWSENICQK